MLFKESIHFVFIIFAALPEYLEGGVGAFVYDPFLDTLVEGAGSEAAAHHKEGLLFGVQAVIFIAFATLSLCGRVYVVAQRVAGKDYLLCREKPLHTVVGHANLLHVGGEFAVGEAGVGVLLLNQAGDAHLGGRHQKGGAGIAPDSHSHVGLEVAQYAAGLYNAGQNLERKHQILKRKLALQARHGKAYNLVARLGHALHLHFALGPYKQYLAFGILCPEGVSNGNRRENVAAGAASAYYESSHIACCSVSFVSVTVVWDPS